MRKYAAVLGGDRRQICLADLLRRDGWEIATWGMEKGDEPFGVSLKCALEAEILILPLPICRGPNLNLPLSDTVLSWDALRINFRPEQIIFGGMTASAGEIPMHIRIHDYYDREEVQIANAVPTAEGAIMRAMEETDGTLYGSQCLVIGYGRIGKVLAHRLRALGAEVVVSARKHSDLAWIEAYGYRAVRTEDLSEHICEFDVIFNTVPAMVLMREQLSAVKPGCLVVELASLPGGIDRNAVKEYNLQVIEERGLPGKVAPVRAAAAIRDGIYHILEEEGILA